MADVIGYLTSKGLTLKKATGMEVHTACPLCSEDPTKRGRLYINCDPDASIPGLFFCHRCGEKGNLITLKKFYGDKVTESDERTEQNSALLEAAATYYHEMLGENEDVFSYLRGPKRGLTTETIMKYRLGYAAQAVEWDVASKSWELRRTRDLYVHLKDLGFTPKEIIDSGLCREHASGKGVVDSLAGMVTIPYLVAGQVVCIRGRSWPFKGDPDATEIEDRGDWADWTGGTYKPPPMKYKTTGGAAARLFNTDATWGADEILVTEGEFDALVLEQLGYTVVGSPGANTWQDSWDGYMAQAKRVFLVFDRDKAGEEGSKKIADRFGPKVRRLFLSEEGFKCDPTSWLADGHTAQEFEELLAAARRGGLLANVHDAVEEFEARQGLPGLKFNIDLLDMVMEPGLQASQLMIILAKTGTGKTIMLLNMMHRMRMSIEQENLKMLFVSLEQTRGEWWDRARRMYRFYHPDQTDADARDWWEDNILIVDKNRLSMVEFNQVIEDFDYRMGQLPDLICLDYLGYWAQSFKGERYERTSDAVMALKGWAKDAMVPLIVPHQVSRMGKDGEELATDAARDSGVIEETADFLLTLWSPDNALGRSEEEKTGKVHMRLGKSRHGGKGTQFDFQWAPCSLVMVPDTDPKWCHVARREFNWRQQYRDNWEKAAYRHRTGHEGHLDAVPDREFEQQGLT